MTRLKKQNSLPEFYDTSVEISTKKSKLRIEHAGNKLTFIINNNQFTISDSNELCNVTSMFEYNQSDMLYNIIGRCHNDWTEPNNDNSDVEHITEYLDFIPVIYLDNSCKDALKIKYTYKVKERYYKTSQSITINEDQFNTIRNFFINNFPSKNHV